jgi:hypothetical protein
MNINSSKFTPSSQNYNTGLLDYNILVKCITMHISERKKIWTLHLILVQRHNPSFITSPYGHKLH